MYTQNEFISLVEKFWEDMVESQPCPPITINNRFKSCLGRAWFNEKTHTMRLEFSKELLLGKYLNESVYDVIKHEICHEICALECGKSQGHNKLWKSVAKKYGVRPFATNNMKINPNYRGFEKPYVIICPHCGCYWEYMNFKNPTPFKYIQCTRCNLMGLKMIRENGVYVE